MSGGCGMNRMDGKSNNICGRFDIASKGEGMSCGVVEVVTKLLVPRSGELWVPSLSLAGSWSIFLQSSSGRRLPTCCPSTLPLTVSTSGYTGVQHESQQASLKSCLHHHGLGPNNIVPKKNSLQVL